MSKVFERRYHCTWARTRGWSPLASLGRWIYEHPRRLASPIDLLIKTAPIDLLTAASADVATRLPQIAAREPTRRHRKHFQWLLGWQMRIANALEARCS